MFLFVVLVAESLSGKPIMPIVPIVQPDESLATRPPAVTKLTMEPSPPAQAELEPYTWPITAPLPRQSSDPLLNLQSKLK